MNVTAIKFICGLVITAVLSASGACVTGEGDGSTAETTTNTPEQTTPADLPTLGEVSDGSSGLLYAENADGSRTVIGIGSCTDTVLTVPSAVDGKAVTAIAPSAFEGNSAITLVTLPSSITSVGAAAFSGCSSLAYISVDPANKSFCDIGGALYTADGSCLVCLPSGVNYTSVTLTLKLTSVADKATAGCKISKVFYEGSGAGWQKIDLGADNSALTAAKLICADMGGK